jgi:hypothetical protein
MQNVKQPTTELCINRFIALKSCLHVGYYSDFYWTVWWKKSLKAARFEIKEESLQMSKKQWKVNFVFVTLHLDRSVIYWQIWFITLSVSKLPITFYTATFQKDMETYMQQKPKLLVINHGDRPPNYSIICEIWGSHGGEYEDDRLLGCSAV